MLTPKQQNRASSLHRIEIHYSAANARLPAVRVMPHRVIRCCTSRPKQGAIHQIRSHISIYAF
ncbi:hypothetical protein, partial [Kingella kingae]|uniref:hypothetical protein n=1 Tax=Kingella kingae TaxID=504 RepID=UPI001E4D057A